MQSEFNNIITECLVIKLITYYEHNAGKREGESERERHEDKQ